MISVNTNTASLIAQRNLLKSSTSMEKAMERLSSGLRINRASDDAAGLAISTSMTAQINGLNQAVRNSNDGISLLSTAEGAIVEQIEILQRMRTLAVQAASDTNTAENRQTIENEISQAREELERITNTIKFNGRTLLDGTFKNMKIQVGANADQNIDTTIADMRASSLGGAVEGASYTSNKPSEATRDNDLLINGKQIVTKSDGTNATGNMWSAKSFVEAINKANVGVTATAEINTFTAGSAWKTGTISENDLTINGIDIYDGTDIELKTGPGGADNLVNAINSKTNLTGVEASIQDNKIRLQSQDGSNITVLHSSNAISDLTKLGSGGSSVGIGGNLAAEINTVGIYRLESDSDIIITGNDPEKAGLRGGAAVAKGGAITGTAGTGELIINGREITGASDMLQYVTAINNVSSDTDVAAGGDAVAMQATGSLHTVAGQSLGAISLNVAGVNNVLAIGDIAVSDLTGGYTQIAQHINDALDVAATHTIFAQNFAAGTVTGANVSNLKIGDIFEARAKADGSGWEFGLKSDAVNFASGSTVGSVGLSAGTGTRWGMSANTLGMDQSTRLVLTNKIGDIEITGSDPDKAGFVPTTITQTGGTIETVDTDILTIDKVSVATSADANKAIVAIDKALAQVSNNRSYIGAMSNRLTSTINNLLAVSENLSAANSRILDADFASETAALTRSQILQQAGVAILAQANMKPQIALSLLG